MEVNVFVLNFQGNEGRVFISKMRYKNNFENIKRGRMKTTDVSLFFNFTQCRNLQRSDAFG